MCGFMKLLQHFGKTEITFIYAVVPDINIFCSGYIAVVDREVSLLWAL